MGKARDRYIAETEEVTILFDNLRAVARRSHAQMMEDIATLERDAMRKIRLRADLEEQDEARAQEDGSYTVTHHPLGGEPREVRVQPGPVREAEAQGRSPDYLSDRSTEGRPVRPGR